MLKIRPTPAFRSQTLELLRSVLGPVQARPECLGCHIYNEDGPEEAIVYCEQWTTRAAFQEHVRSDFYRRVLAALDLSSQPPEIQVHHVSKTEGIEMIQQLRCLAQTETAEGEEAVKQ